MRTKFILFLSVVFVISCGKKEDESNTSQNKQQNTTQIKNEKRSSDMKITSNAFKEGELIPTNYTCDGANYSPQLSWSDAPTNVKSFAIISDDPDAPMGTWVHWVIFNIPANISELKENLPKDKTLNNGSIQGKNDFGNNGYDGPCPPGGTHRYFFKLYALDTMLASNSNMTKSDLLKSMESHILGEASLMGKYKR